MRYILLLLIIIPSIAFSQGKPFAIWEDPATSDYWFVSLNAANGVKSNINIIPGLDAFVAGDNAVLNGDLHYYHFIGLNGTDLRFYTIDVITGNVVYDPIITENIVGIQYNCNDSLLYGLREINNIYDLVTLNPVSATATSIVGVNSILGYVAETFSFNPRSHLYSFAVISGGLQYLRTYNVLSGALVHDNVFTENITAQRFSCSDSATFGLWEDGTVYKLEKIDFSTGTHTTVNTLAGIMPGYVFESASVNASGNYIYRGFDSLNNYSLISIDLSNGTILNIVNTSDNAAGFQEAMCCYDLTTQINSLVDEENLFIYPSPFRDQLNIRSPLEVEQVELYSLVGQYILKINPKHNTSVVSFSLPDLSRGIYFIYVRFNNGTYTWNKIIKD